MACSGFSPDSDLSDIISELWDMDDNKCYPGTDYDINLQGYVTTTNTARMRDYSEDNLIQWVDEEQVFARPTYKAFRDLLNNYEMDVNEEEKLTREEMKENRVFIDAVMETKVMQRAHSFLIERKAADADENKFKRMLHKTWFDFFRRKSSAKGSSSFEHVFVGETRDDQFLGLHNWIQFYEQEKAGNIDYHGYFRRETETRDEAVRLLAVQFSWKGQLAKPFCSVFIGSSPEFEIAAYTICTLLDKDGDDKVDVKMGEYETELTVHAFGSPGYRKIGTAFFAAARIEQHGKQYQRKRKH